MNIYFTFENPVSVDTRDEWYRQMMHPVVQSTGRGCPAAPLLHQALFIIQKVKIIQMDKRKISCYSLDFADGH